MTQVFLQDAVVDDLVELFKYYKVKNSLGVEREVRVFRQDTPIREGEDVEDDLEAGTEAEGAAEAEDPDVPEPYIIVRLPGGEVPEQDENQSVDVILIVCVCDPDRNRQGYRDALHIVNTILDHYGSDGLVGKKFQVKYPIRWATGEEDNHPYYFAAVALKFDAPAIFKEVPET